MDVIVVDSDMAAKLKGLHVQVELCDQYGKKLGKFVPEIDWSGLEALTPEISDEERAPRKASTEPRMTSQEMLASLEEKARKRREKDIRQSSNG